MRPIRSILLVLALLAAMIFSAFPLYWMVISSLEPGNLFNFPPHFWPHHPDLGNFVAIFRLNPLGRWLANSFFVAVGTAVAAVLLSIHAAYALSRFRSRAVERSGFLILLGQMIPVTVLTIPFYQLFRAFHLMDTLTGVIVAATTFAVPMALWMLRGFFDAVPRELDEAALTDGCTRLQALYRVILPAALPGIAASTAFAFMLGWNEYFFANLFLSSESKWVGTVGLVTYMSEYAVQWSQLLATAVVMSLVPAVVFLYLQRYLVSGLVQGAVKQ